AAADKPILLLDLEKGSDWIRPRGEVINVWVFCTTANPSCLSRSGGLSGWQSDCDAASTAMRFLRYLHRPTALGARHLKRRTRRRGGAHTEQCARRPGGADAEQRSSNKLAQKAQQGKRPSWCRSDYPRPRSRPASNRERARSHRVQGSTRVK